MNTNFDNKLKLLHSSLQSNRPVRASKLLKLGISDDLLVYYVKAGWLERLSNGVYMKPAADLDFNECVSVLQESIKGLHIGGKSALSLYGIRHYMSNKPTTQLYSWDSVTLPDWFSSRFSCDIQRKRLFEESPEEMLNVSNFNGKPGAPMVSEPERAALEMLSSVGVNQTLTEAEEVLEGAFSLRADVMAGLLRKCKSVKTVRLFLNVASKLSLPVHEELKDQKFPVGSSSNWVWKTLVLKP